MHAVSLPAWFGTCNGAKRYLGYVEARQAELSPLPQGQAGGLLTGQDDADMNGIVR